MIKAIITQDFFSFKGENRIELNDGINILLGINGSGKTTFLNAFRLLYEGVAGIGFEKVAECVDIRKAEQLGDLCNTQFVGLQQFACGG